jgi:hypothetical protein
MHPEMALEEMSNETFNWKRGNKTNSKKRIISLTIINIVNKLEEKN